jgi:hypothetical protein
MRDDGHMDGGDSKATETSTFIRYLDNQRDHVLGILEDLPADALLQPVLPSGWTCLGLVRHLAVDVEEFWFERVVAGRPFDEDEFGTSATAAWDVAAGTDPDVVFDRYRRAIGQANDVITHTALDTPPAAWPVELWPNWRLQDLRTIILHVLAETACHAGHLDAARELLDGRTWMRVG